MDSSIILYIFTVSHYSHKHGYLHLNYKYIHRKSKYLCHNYEYLSKYRSVNQSDISVYSWEVCMCSSKTKHFLPFNISK